MRKTLPIKLPALSCFKTEIIIKTHPLQSVKTCVHSRRSSALKHTPDWISKNLITLMDWNWTIFKCHAYHQHRGKRQKREFTNIIHDQNFPQGLFRTDVSQSIYLKSQIREF